MEEVVMTSQVLPCTLVEGLWEQQQQGVFVDLELAFSCGNTTSVHSCVMSAVSSVVDELFRRAGGSSYRYIKSRLIENEEKIIVFSGFTYDGFEPLLRYMYTGKLYVHPNNVFEVQAAAEVLELEEAMKYCKSQAKCSVQLNRIDSVMDTIENFYEHARMQEDIEKSPPVLKGVGRSLRKRKSTNKSTEKADNTTKSHNTKKSARTVKTEIAKQKTKKKSKQETLAIQEFRDSGDDVISEPIDDDDADPDFMPPDIPSKGSTRKEAKTNDRAKLIFKSSYKMKPKEENRVKRQYKKRKKAKETTRQTRSKIKNDKGENEPISDAVKSLMPTHLCSFCPYKFYHMSSLKFHLRKHKWTQVISVAYKNSVYKAKVGVPSSVPKISDNTKFKCLLCSAQFMESTKYKYHVKRKHKLHFSCKKCSKKFTSLKLLKFHQLKKSDCRAEHLKQRFYCYVCNRIFLHMKTLLAHYSTSHPGYDLSTAPKASFDCRHCRRKSLHTSRQFISHLTSHQITERELCNAIKKIKSEKKGVQCKICLKYYASIRSHMINVHGEKRLHTRVNDRQIPICTEEGCNGRRFKELKHLRAHVDKVHPDANYECTRCTRFKGKIKASFERHVQYLHMGKARHRCSVCDKAFLTRTNTKRHEHRHHGMHPNMKMFPCDQCDFKGYTPHVLMCHKRKHETERKFTCKICDKIFKREKNVKKHMNRVHLNIKPYVCENCGKAYAEDSELKIHILSHGDTFAFHCEHCDYKCQQKHIFQEHLFKAHKIKEGRFKNMLQCELCGYESDRPFKFKEHMNRHNGIRPYKCSQCDKAFFNSHNLKGHVSWVHTVRKIECEYCVFMAPNIHALKEHQRIVHTHRDVKPYKCAYCDYHCKISGNCRKHIKQKHKGLEVRWIKVCEKFPINHAPTEPIFEGNSSVGRPIMSKNNKFERVAASNKSSSKPKKNVSQEPILQLNQTSIVSTHALTAAANTSLAASFIMDEQGVVENRLAAQTLQTMSQAFGYPPK